MSKSRPTNVVPSPAPLTGQHAHEIQAFGSVVAMPPGASLAFGRSKGAWGIVMGPLGSNPFGMLTFIVAPAILTNASSIMTLTTSNRLARAIDHARALSSQVEGRINGPDPDIALWVRQLESAERQALLVVRALTAFYLSVGSFAAVGLLSLLGAVFAVGREELLGQIALGVVLCAGVAGVVGLVGGTGLLVWETRIALHDLAEETKFRLQHHHGTDKAASPA